VYSLVEDEDYTARVEAVIERMRPHLTQDHIAPRVFVFDGQEFAAFTTPGGYIYVSTGLLDLLESDDELALIIGHELGHSENNHTAELARLIKYMETAERGRATCLKCSTSGGYNSAPPAITNPMRSNAISPPYT